MQKIVAITLLLAISMASAAQSRREQRRASVDSVLTAGDIEHRTIPSR